MSDYTQHGFFYVGGGFLKARPTLKHQQEPQFADHPYLLDLGMQGSVQFTPVTMEAITVQFVAALTEHGPVSMEALDRISYLVDEARMNHPDQVWSNGPIGPDMPPAVADFMAINEWADFLTEQSWDNTDDLANLIINRIKEQS